MMKTPPRFTSSLAIGLVGLPAALLCLGSANANAEVDEVASSPQVTSRQALVISDDALRVAAPGQARGRLATRSGEEGIVHAQGEVRDSVKAVTGTSAAPFGVEQNGAFDVGAPIGDW